MNNVQKSCNANTKCILTTQRGHLLSAAVLFLTLLLAGCGKTSSHSTTTPPSTPETASSETAVPKTVTPETGSPETAAAPETGSAFVSQEPFQSATLQSFSPDEAEVVPEIPLYQMDIHIHLDTAEELGTVQKLYGILPGASDGTWYTLTVDGIEYYYGIYSFDEQSKPQLYGYAVFDDSYCLTNGIKVGMTEDDILAAYPNMAVMDFDGNFLRDKIDCLGWNFSAYPRSYLDMDASFNYDGTDYFWSDQFDHLLIAEIDQNSPEALPLYLALLIKDQSVAAITFYHPTAN